MARLKLKSSASSLQNIVDEVKQESASLDRAQELAHVAKERSESELSKAGLTPVKQSDKNIENLNKLKQMMSSREETKKATAHMTIENINIPTRDVLDKAKPQRAPADDEKKRRVDELKAKRKIELARQKHRAQNQEKRQETVDTRQLPRDVILTSIKDKLTQPKQFKQVVHNILMPEDEFSGKLPRRENVDVQIVVTYKDEVGNVIGSNTFTRQVVKKSFQSSSTYSSLNFSNEFTLKDKSYALVSNIPSRLEFDHSLTTSIELVYTKLPDVQEAKSAQPVVKREKKPVKRSSTTVQSHAPVTVKIPTMIPITKREFEMTDVRREYHVTIIKYINDEEFSRVDKRQVIDGVLNKFGLFEPVSTNRFTVELDTTDKDLIYVSSNLVISPIDPYSLEYHIRYRAEESIAKEVIADEISSDIPQLTPISEIDVSKIENHTQEIEASYIIEGKVAKRNVVRQIKLMHETLGLVDTIEQSHEFTAKVKDGVPQWDKDDRFVFDTVRLGEYLDQKHMTSSRDANSLFITPESNDVIETVTVFDKVKIDIDTEKRVIKYIAIDHGSHEILKELTHSRKEVHTLNERTGETSIEKADFPEIVHLEFKDYQFDFMQDSDPNVIELYYQPMSKIAKSQLPNEEVVKASYQEIVAALPKSNKDAFYDEGTIVDVTSFENFEFNNRFEQLVRMISQDGQEESDGYEIYHQFTSLGRPITAEALADEMFKALSEDDVLNLTMTKDLMIADSSIEVDGPFNKGHGIFGQIECYEYLIELTLMSR